MKATQNKTTEEEEKFWKIKNKYLFRERKREREREDGWLVVFFFRLLLFFAILEGSRRRRRRKKIGGKNQTNDVCEIGIKKLLLLTKSIQHINTIIP